MSAQANIVQINTKTILVTMGAFMATMMATTLISVGMIVPSLAHADTVQTANANPVYQVPAGYTLVPASTPTGSCAGAPVPAGIVTPAISLHTMPAALAMVLPNYSSVINQTHNETNTNNNYSYSDSFNTTNTSDSNNGNGSNNTSDSNNGNGSNNGNASNNGNGSNNTTDSNNTSSNTTTTTTTNDSHNTNNSNNTDNSNTTTTSVSNASNVIVANGTISL